MKLKKWILAGLVFVVLLAVVFLLIKPTSPPQAKLPNPNGYDDLVKAGKMIVGSTPDCNFDNSECIDGWKVFLGKNKEALELARIGLSRESRVPLSLTNHAVAIFRDVALTFQAEGQIAEKEKRLDDAIESFLEIIVCSQKIRGGNFIDALVSLAIESTGMQPLQKISNEMSADQRWKVITHLSDIYSNRETFEEVVTMESTYNRRLTTLREKIENLRYYFSSKDVARKLKLRMKYRKARMGLLLVDLAVRNYQSEKGHLPQTLGALVPEYLSFLPADDFSGADFVYHPQSNGFLLYGVGYDEKDDGGKPLSDRTTEATGDMLSTSPF